MDSSFYHVSRTVALCIRSSVFEDECDRLNETLSGGFLGHPLTVGAGNFRTVRYVPAILFFNHGGEVLLHIRMVLQGVQGGDTDKLTCDW